MTAEVSQLNAIDFKFIQIEKIQPDDGIGAWIIEDTFIIQ